MKYVEYTYVDAKTSVAVTDAPAVNGPVPPDVIGLAFAFARESEYPTNVPVFYGTCADDSNTAVPGVLRVITEHDYNVAHADEMAARNPVPTEVDGWQAEVAMRITFVDPDAAESISVWDRVQEIFASMPNGVEKTTAQTVLARGKIRHDSLMLAQLAPLVPLTQERVDGLLRLAKSIEA